MFNNRLSKTEGSTIALIFSRRTLETPRLCQFYSSSSSSLDPFSSHMAAIYSDLLGGTHISVVCQIVLAYGTAGAGWFPRQFLDSDVAFHGQPDSSTLVWWAGFDSVLDLDHFRSVQNEPTSSCLWGGLTVQFSLSLLELRAWDSDQTDWDKDKGSVIFQFPFSFFYSFGVGRVSSVSLSIVYASATVFVQKNLQAQPKLTSSNWTGRRKNHASLINSPYLPHKRAQGPNKGHKGN
jgi:hypothetical protein